MEFTKSKVQLVDSKITNFEIALNLSEEQEVKFDPAVLEEYNIEYDIAYHQLGELDDNANIRQTNYDGNAIAVGLNIYINYDEENPKEGYMIRMDAAAIFKVKFHGEKEEEIAIEMFENYITATSVIIGFIRSYLENATSHYPIEKYVLPVGNSEKIVTDYFDQLGEEMGIDDDDVKDLFSDLDD